MRLSPEDPELRKALRHLAKRSIRQTSEETIMFLDDDCKVVEAVYPSEIEAGGHLLIRDRLLDEARLQAILHLGLVHDGERQCYVHVVDPDAHDDGSVLSKLMTLRQSEDNHVYWIPTPMGAQVAWQRRWLPDQ